VENIEIDLQKLPNDLDEHVRITFEKGIQMSEQEHVVKNGIIRAKYKPFLRKNYMGVWLKYRCVTSKVPSKFLFSLYPITKHPADWKVIEINPSEEDKFDLQKKKDSLVQPRGTLNIDSLPKVWPSFSQKLRVLLRAVLA
jgi:hypothetical protein